MITTILSSLGYFLASFFLLILTLVFVKKLEKHNKIKVTNIFILTIGMFLSLIYGITFMLTFIKILLSI